MCDRPPDSIVRAAGGVLWRRCDGTSGDRRPRSDRGRDPLEVAVIHRPRYDDWTLPKGKLHRGERALDGALREVHEETGYRSRPGAALGATSYPHTRDGRTRTKVVRYWALEALNGGFTAGDEVDELRWLPPEDAAALLSYDRDRDVLARFVRLHRTLR